MTYVQWRGRGACIIGLGSARHEHIHIPSTGHGAVHHGGRCMHVGKNLCTHCILARRVQCIVLVGSQL